MPTHIPVRGLLMLCVLLAAAACTAPAVPPLTATPTVAPTAALTATPVMPSPMASLTNPAAATPTTVATLPPPLALVNGSVIDGTGAAAVPDAAVVIAGGRIAAVGPRAQVSIPTGAQVLDVRGGTILPGLVNAHVHNAYLSGNLALWAKAGVTTVRDLGAPCNSTESCRSFLEMRDQFAKQARYARVVGAGPIVTVPGGYPIAIQNFSSLAVTSPEDAQQKVQQLLDAGSDGIKMAIESGVPALSLEEAKAIVAAAHQRHTWVSVHVTYAADLERGVEAGVDDVAHVVIDPLPEEWLRRIVAVGKVALGSDAGYLAGLRVGMPLEEITDMQAAGMSPMQIIVAATQNAAHVCGLDSEIGTLEAGKAGDVLVVSGDPLQSLEALDDVQAVVHGGTVIRNEIR